ncbi:hypothetical protein H0177_29410 [Bacillus cereus]|uniref:hypothetical protein n=1 Tax=Bacillus cereus TaxID=1396 RepID=UPI001C8EB2A7|nr:hypothetical protein [Bacillus cereus]MBY0134323.1 hypothetical protein [Bacillus cereus]
MHQSNLAGVVLKGVDLSTCLFDNITISLGKLQGCIISTEQAIGFSKLLGVIVKDS